MGIVGFVVVALTATVGVSLASAKTVGIARTKAGVLAPGAKIRAFSSDLIFETTAGNLECDKNELLGTLTDNEVVKIHGKVTEEFSTGDNVEPKGACKTSATGPVTILSSGLPWPTEFTTKGQSKTKGTKKIGFTSTFLALEPPNNKCTFEASTVKSTFTPGTEGHPVPVVQTVVKQKFKINKKAPNTAPICPKEGVLSGHFTIEAGPGFSEAVESEVVKK